MVVLRGRDDGVAEDDLPSLMLKTGTHRLQWGRDDGVAEDVKSCAALVACHGFNGAATMGSRKTTAACGASVLPDQRFNGAATMGSRKTLAGPEGPPHGRLEWGRDDGVAEDVGRRHETPSTEPSFNGAATMGRGRRESGSRRAQGSRFNGAATMGSRKTQCDLAPMTSTGQLRWGRDDGVAEDQRSMGRCHRSASMGPRRWGRGRPATTMVAGPVRSFNGAATMGSRKTTSRTSSSGACSGASMGPRRWGRGRRTAVVRPRAAHASMGPRRWGRGRRLLEPLSLERVGSGFNGAATMGSRKTSPPSQPVRLGPVASMGPRRWGRGRREPGREGTRFDPGASIGPRRWGRGRPDECAVSPDHGQLQWGRDDGVAEDARYRGCRACWSCFNGAATMGSRKTPTRCQARRGFDASMGPRRWGRGRPASYAHRGDQAWLRWGRDDGVAEDRGLYREGLT